MARLAAERKLNEAEHSLHKLDHAVTTQTPNIEQDVKDEMVVNVKKLKSKLVSSSIAMFDHVCESMVTSCLCMSEWTDLFVTL